jgi:outer membrane immunogenic protein
MAATALFTAISGGAKAQSLTPQPESTPSQSATMSAREAAMQAEIAALKAENRELRKRRDRPATASAVATAPLATSLAVASSTPSLAPRAPVRSAEAYAMAPGSSPGASSIWTGAYMGVSLGVGGTHATASGSSSSFNTGVPTDDTFGGSSTFNAGAVADLYAGYSRQWGNWVGGVQAEASLGRLSSRIDETATGEEPITLTNSLNLNFMVSALGRVGYLIDPHDQIYGLAGWTFAGFSTTATPFGGGGLVFDSSSFGVNGVTVGAGWERQIADQWTLRAEYRYTKFQNVTLSSSFSTVSGSGGQASTTLSPDLQVVRVGLTRYFDESVAPAAMFTKAPGATATSWTGSYAGVSVGLGGENTRATTTSSSTFINTAAGFMETTSDNNLIAGDRQFGGGGVADLFIGYNRQMNDWVGGVQLEGTLARFNERLARTNTDRSSGTTTFGGMTTVNTGQVLQSQFDTLSQNWVVTAAARLGRLVTAHDLIYGLAGWSFANFSTSIETDSAAGGTSQAVDDRTFNTSGPTVGIGWERQLADQWSLRAEYRYTHFLDKTLSSSSSDASTSNGTNVSSSTSQSTISADSHIVRFGVARAFGG